MTAIDTDIEARELPTLSLLSVILRGERSERATTRVPAALRALADDEASLARALTDGAGLEAMPPRGRARLVAAVELGLRVASALSSTRAPPLPDPAAVAAWGARLTPLDHEELWTLALDGQNGLRAARRVAMGGLHGLEVSLADPLRVALRAGASSFILVHNHPSGDPTPSRHDVTFTARVAAAAALVGAPLVDHVIVARGGHVSLLERGLLSGDASSATPAVR